MDQYVHNVNIMVVGSAVLTTRCIQTILAGDTRYNPAQIVSSVRLQWPKGEESELGF